MAADGATTPQDGEATTDDPGRGPNGNKKMTLKKALKYYRNGRVAEREYHNPTTTKYKRHRDLPHPLPPPPQFT
jgi:hypothetical protein